MERTHRMKRMAVISALLLSGAFAVPAAQALEVTAYVVHQTCRHRGETIVRLSARVSPTGQTVKYRWDFNNDGVWDTVASTDPLVTHTYPDDESRTARVRAVKANGVRAFDRVTFRTRLCK